MPKMRFVMEDLYAGCAALKAKRKFTPGFDKMTPDAAETWLKFNGETICKQLNSGKYHCMPAIGFNVAKKDGRYRKLARLTAIDTIVQMTINDKLSDYCCEKYSEYSFAYCRGRGTGNALNLFCKFATENFFAAKIDIKSCFDNIAFDVLEKALYRFFYDRKTVELLMDCAKMPVITEGQLSERKKGILQGAPVSGMLCNIYLNELDKELTDKNISFIRYADDIVVFAKTSAEAQSCFDFVCGFLKDTLRLQVNAGKSNICAPEDIVFLGQKFARDKDGSVIINSCEKTAATYYDWYTSRPANSRRSIDVLSDGVMRQKDFSAVFESETDKYNLPLDSLERINIFSSVIFDSGFLESAMNAGVFVNIFGRDYSYIGRFVPSSPLKSQRLIFEQLSIYNSDMERLAYAKAFDLASIHNLRLNIRYYNKYRQDDIYERALYVIDKLFQRMKNCKSYEELLMVEAQARGVYCGCFDAFISNDKFAFKKRTRKPPLNEVNSLISFGNVVLYNYIATELYKSSLDIRVGFLHATNNREESLNLDIAEIFKPLIVDRVVFSLINRMEITPRHFETEANGGIYLNEEGKRIFLRKFYEKLNATLFVKGKYMSYASLIDDEIRKLTRSIRNKEKYKAFRQVR